MTKLHDIYPRTYRAKVLTYSQIEESPDHRGRSASKLWNVAISHPRQVSDELGEIPDDLELKGESKTHINYKRLHSPVSAFWRNSLKALI
jgi:putative transposase